MSRYLHGLTLLAVALAVLAPAPRAVAGAAAAGQPLVAFDAPTTSHTLELLVEHVDGSAPTQITPDDGHNHYEPAWAPDGTRLAFVNAVNGSNNPVVTTVGVDGSRTQTVAPGSDPSWSPDGTRVALNDPYGALVSVRLDGSGRVVLDAGSATTPPQRSHTCPAWSPDGRYVAVFFQSFQDGGKGPNGESDELRVVKADGSGLVYRRDLGTSQSCPSWSPDATRLAFAASGSSATTQDVLTMRPDGSDIRDLASANCTTSRDPVWSRDGATIAFAREVGSDNPLDPLSPRCPPQQTRGVWAVRPDGTALRQLAATDIATSISWSPDSSVLAFQETAVNQNSSTSTLHTIRIDGSKLTNLGGGIHASQPVFSPVPIVFAAAGGSPPTTSTSPRRTTSTSSIEPVQPLNAVPSPSNPIPASDSRTSSRATSPRKGVVATRVEPSGPSRDSGLSFWAKGVAVLLLLCDAALYLRARRLS